MATGEPMIQLPIVYVGLEDVPILFGNHFIIQHEQNEFIFTVGQLTPPILLGTPEERLEQAKKLSYVPVRVVARLGFTRQRLEELIGALQENLRAYDERQKGQR